MLDSDKQNVLQTAYRLTLWEDARLLWDTGKVESRDNVGIPCPEGIKLAPSTSYRVQLVVWDNQGEEAEAETAFETGLLDTAHPQGLPAEQ